MSRLSTLSSKRTVLALWALAALLAAALTAVLLLRDSPSDDVSAYIEEVNATQQTFAIRYGSVDRAYREFRLAPAEMEEQLPRLREAARTLADLRARVAAVEAPPEARTLRERLLAFLRQQELVAEELVTVAEYLPKLGASERPVAVASGRLRTALRTAETPDEQASALARYGTTLIRTAKQLEAIEPPPLLAPAHRSALALQSGVRARDQAAVDAATRSLDAATASGSQKAQREAIKAYNGRIREIARLGAALERERLRLERDLA